ncbi:alpha/beta hydrolase [Pusillimonas noertemannii]|uniref:Phospholipase/carboxylesterase n=1 Tax=Pusillimonas noertemannii TaxID=305977 RepID=A0A2U1CQL2_9BURK|nr:dienelactone hydrolase family protein [Pusillimonas noertemannii]NYT67504.1 dienelactone hydrolase family protein [Pusillimonas noertemannii]PVY68177.1 phospholipase/carboxylesterase [Pusillimonas noertemannii]TFL12325.1 carboxylesterase [Pusillimonas noertemannii]
MKPELLDALELETAPNPTHAVIWLHGLGADGNDFAPIVPELRLGNAPAVRFVFPHAPVQPVTINGGMAMRAWYDIRNADLAQREDAQGILQSQEAVRALIQRENQRGIATGNIVLAGFSQGCAMTLQTGLRLPERLAGLVALSGYLPLAESLQAEFSPANKETPIFMAHGTQDPVVPLQRAQKSCQLLQEMGYSVDWKTYPMPHSVCLEEVNDIAAFLKQVLRG